MSSTLHHTRGIVLRSVKYGETSLIVSIYTELFGLQSYLVNNVRTSTKKGSGKANLFQPSAILELIVYHNDLKNLQRIKEFKWAVLYQHVLFEVIHNSVALFMIELVNKTIRQPEANPDLYYFIEDALVHLDRSSDTVVANYPVYFSSHLASFFGFRISDEYSETHHYLDLQEGAFVSERPVHLHYLDEPYSFQAAQFMKAQQPVDLEEIKINQEKRRKLLEAYILFYQLHIPEFGMMKTLPVLQEVL